MELRWLVLRRNYGDVFPVKPRLQFWSDQLHRWFDVPEVDVHEDVYDPEVYEPAGENKDAA